MSKEAADGLQRGDYEALLDAVSQAALVSVTDARGDILFVNDKFVDVSKYSRQELIGQNHRILKSQKQPQEMFVTLWKTISSGRIWRGEIMNRAKDGSYYWVDTSIVPILNIHGIPERYLAVRFVITDKKKVEKRVTDQNRAILNVLEDLEDEKDNYKLQAIETQKFFMAVENTSEHIVITDPDGVVVYSNTAAERTTGFDKKEIMGSKAGVLWGRQMSSAFYREMWTTIKTKKQIFSGEINNIRKSGEPYIAQATIVPILDKKGKILFFVGSERDITKEKEVDRAKTEFVSLASHQLRTPLSSINWYSEMLLNGDVGNLNEDQKSYLQEVYDANARMVKLINSLLNVSRLELGTFSLEPEMIDPLESAKQMVKEAEILAAGRGQSIVTKFDSKTPKIFFDEQYLQMIYQNLLSNAIKYSPAKTKIEIAISPASNETRIGGRKLPGRGICIKVSDHGYGIPKTQQSKIFSKMFRADNARTKDTDGTGLGLYIIKAVVDYCHGIIWFDSEINKGTSFFVYLPLKTARKIGTKRID